MAYLYASNIDSLDRRTNIQIQMDSGTTAVLRMGHFYDLTANELARARQYIVLTASDTAQDEEPQGIIFLPVRGNPEDGEVPVWDADQGVFVPGFGGGGGGGNGVVAALAPNGNYWEVSVDDLGNLDTTNVGIIDPAMVTSVIDYAGHYWELTATNDGELITTDIGTSSGGGPPYVPKVDLEAFKDSLPINLADYCAGNGTDRDDLGFQEALDAMPAEGGRLISPPGMKYRFEAGVTQLAKADFEIDLNGSWIECRVPTGVIWTIKGGHRGKIKAPQFRLMSGAPSAFMSIPSGAVGVEYSWWVTIYEPVFWSHINIPANLDGIVVDDDNYWIEIVRPRMRKLSGTLTGLFRRGISFTSQSNACKVLGGSINNAATGVYIDSCNSNHVSGTAFEFVNKAVELVDTLSPCAGTLVDSIRTEVCPIAVDLSGHTDRSFQSPISIGDISNQDGEATRGHEIWNPNNIPITRKTGEYISLDTSWASMKTGLKIKAADNQGLWPVVELEQRDISAPSTALTVAPGTGAMSGAGTLTVASTALPIAFAASGVLQVEGTTAAGARTYEFFSYTGITATTFTGVTRALGGSAAQAHEIGSQVRASFNRTFAIDNNGALMMRGAAAALPAPADDRLIIHHRAFISRLLAWRPDGAGSRISLSVASAAAAIVDVLNIFEASIRPGVDATTDIGVIGTRWRNLFLSAQVNTGFQLLATDAIFTLSPLTSPQNTLHTGTLTANRVVTLSTTAVQAGMMFRIARTGGGAFTLDVSSTPAKSLAQNTWAEFIYNGSAWTCFEQGTLP